MLPALLFAYANDIDEYLPALDLEKVAIAESLNPLMRTGKLFYEDDIHTTEKLTEALINNQRVCLFHFAGHATSRQLLFEDRTSEIKGVVPLLKLQKHLFLVVLNGCSTTDQVKRLLDVGIPAVIATKNPVKDLRAKEFAKILYEVLAKGDTLIDAFEAALSPELGKDEGQVLEQKKTPRGIGYMNKSRPDEPEWELGYLPENKSRVHNWTLPQGDDNQGSQEDEDILKNRDEVNRSLTEALYDIIDENQPEKLKNDEGYKYKKNEQGTILHEMQDKLIKALPNPIGEQIRLLFQRDGLNKVEILCSIGKKRLIRLINAFDVMTELILYVLMAQLWKEKKINAAFVISESCRQTLYDYFDHTPNEFRKADVLPAIRAIREVLEYNKVAIFIDEIDALKKILDNNQEFKVAYEFMQLMKQAKIDNKLKASYRKETEYHFINILRNIGFITRYNLLNIRDISVVRRRHLRFDYKHLDEQGGAFDIRNDCFDNHSILLVKKSNHQTKNNNTQETPDLDYLNLSPFVVDNNALKEVPEADILFFECCDKIRKIYSYKQIMHAAHLISFPDDDDNYQSTEIINSILEVLEEFINSFNNNSNG